MLIQRRKIVWIEPFMIRENFWYLTIYRVSCAGKFACFAPASISPDLDFVVICVWPRVTRVSRSQGEVPQLSLAPRISILDTGYYISRCSLASHYTGGKICVENISHFSIKVQILDHTTPLYLTSLHPPVYRSVSSPGIAKNQDKWDLLLLLLLLFWGQVFLF